MDADAATPLLYVLRDDLGLNGAKYGCGLGQCGSCTVLVDDKAVLSCITPVAVFGEPAHHDARRTGLQRQSRPQCRQAFVAEQAAQCGYCIPGMILRAEALLRG